MKTNINWLYFPKTEKPSKELIKVVSTFEKHSKAILKQKNIDASSVLGLLAADLKKQGFHLSSSNGKVAVPVLYGLNGMVENQFLIDAYEPKAGIVLEVEAAAAVINNLYLKDIFEASLMDGANYLIIALRNTNPTSNGQKDFETVCRFLEAIYSSKRLNLPIQGLLIIGYL